MSLRIVRVIPFHEPARCFGGVVTQSALTSRELARRGHRVTVLTTDLDVDPAVPRGVRVDRGGIDVVYGAASRPWHRQPPYPTPLPRAEFDDAIADADVALLNVGLTLLNRTAARAARRAGVSYVYNAEGALCPTRLAVKRLRKALFLPLVERPILRRAAALVACTAAEREDLARQGADPERIAVIPNGVPIPDPVDPAARRGARQRLGVSDDAVVVLFLGRLDPLKGVDLLIDAVARVAAPELHLVVAGPDGGAERALRARAAVLGSRVRFAGVVEATERDRAFSAADLFALTSRSEGLPNAVLEAAAAGLPCLVTDACHVPEVAECEAGAVVPCRVDAIAAALTALLAGDRRAIGERARRMAAERFALDRVVDLLEALLIDVAGR